MKLSIDFEKLNEYQVQAARTMPMEEPENPFFYLPNWATGVCGEAAELYNLTNYEMITMHSAEFRAAFKKEVGDICWYLAAFCSSAVTNWKFGDVILTTSTREDVYPMSGSEITVTIMETAGKIAETVKKIVYHDHNEYEKLQSQISQIFFYLQRVIALLDLDMHEILDGNIAKLKARYPDGFDTEKSKNRVENDG